MAGYFQKMRGTTKSPPRVSLSEIAWSWIGAFVGIGFIAFANYHVFEKADLILTLNADLTEQNPVLAFHVKRAIRRGAELVAVSSTGTRIADIATARLNAHIG